MRQTYSKYCQAETTKTQVRDITNNKYRREETMQTQVRDVTKITITLDGLTGLMFDRYAGDNKTQLPNEAKMYFLPKTQQLCLPALNLMSFLSARNTTSIAKGLGGKQYSGLCDAMLSYVSITPDYIPIMRDGKPIVFNGFIDGRDELAGIYIHKAVARLPKGIPNPKERPVLELPWSITFTLTLFKNSVVDETFLKTAFLQGGLSIGLGTFRGVFGKFVVAQWEHVK